MGTYRERDKAYVNIILITANVMVFPLFELTGDTEDAMFMVKHGVVYEPLVVMRGEYYRLFTSTFLHFGASHLMNNMLALLVLGERMEQALGHEKYFFFYMASGISANIISIVVHMEKGRAAVPTGASGATLGVVGGLVYVVAVNHGQLDGFTNRQLGFMTLLTLYHGFTTTGIDSWAHIGGLISGFILSILLYRRPYAARGSYMEEQKQSCADHSRRRTFNMVDNNCTLCKIANGVIPSTTLYEDEQFRAILDLGPASKGHALIPLEQHFADVCTLDEETASEILPLGAKIGTAMKKSSGCTGFNLVRNNGESAGQTVFHFHMHVILRYENSPLIVSRIPGNATPEELVQTAEQIKSGL